MKLTFTRTVLAAAAFLTVAGATGGPAAADRPGWHRGHGHGHVERHVERRVVRHHYHKHRKYKDRPTVRYTPPRRVVHTERHVYVHRYEPRRYYEERHYYGGHGGGINVDKSTGGTIVGALVGGLLGSQVGSGSGRTVAIAGGAVIGGLVGHEIGRSMEQTDRLQVQRTLESTPTGQTIAWKNPRTGNQYAVTPTRTYRSSSNLNCRDYSTWVFIGGYEEEVTGTACRMPDGSWRSEQS